MPKVPISPMSPEREADLAIASRAAGVVAKRYRETGSYFEKPKEPSRLQKSAAKRVKSMFNETRDTKEFKDRFNAGWSPVRAHTPEMQHLDQALEIADAVDKANGIEHSKYAAEQRATWRTALARRQ